MLFNDGEYIIYVLQHQEKSGKWVFSNLDRFGENLDGEAALSEPWRSFTACGECWQTAGIKGSFNKEIAFRFLLSVSDLNPDYRFRIVEVHIIQKVKIKEPDQFNPAQISAGQQMEGENAMRLSDSRKALVIMFSHNKAIVEPLLVGDNAVNVDKMNEQLDKTLDYHDRLRGDVEEIVLVKVEKIYKPKTRKVFELEETRV